MKPEKNGPANGPINLYCDGGCLGSNPSAKGVYWSVGKEVQGFVGLLVKKEESALLHTNNEAEYAALIACLHECRLIKEDVIINSDSQLIVQQMAGNWKVKNDRLKKLHNLAQCKLEELKKSGKSVIIKWIPREENVKRLGH